MKKVCVINRSENNKKKNKYYCDALKSVGLEPIFITKDNISVLNVCSGILLPGGCKEDNIDNYLIEYSNKFNIPLLGICLGMQMMGMYNNNLELKNVENHYFDENKYIHNVYLYDSNLKNILQTDKIKVNSYHNYALADKGGYKIVGKSSDGVIEAIEKDNHIFQVGVQWHPERMISYDNGSRLLFKEFSKKIKK